MRLYCLSDDPNLPCFILTVHGRSILLDFPLPTDHLLDYLPVPSPGCLNHFSSLPKYNLLSTSKDAHLSQQIDELRLLHNQIYVYSPIEFYTCQSSQYDFSLIDIILISNYESLLALPYLFQKYPQLNAQIYLTEPTYRFGQQLMYELVAYVEQQSKMIQIDHQWRTDPDLFDAIEEQQQKSNAMKLFAHAQKLMPCYSVADVDRLLESCHTGAFQWTNRSVQFHTSDCSQFRLCSREATEEDRFSRVIVSFQVVAIGQLDLYVNHNQTSKIETSSSSQNAYLSLCLHVVEHDLRSLIE